MTVTINLRLFIQSSPFHNFIAAALVVSLKYNIHVIASRIHLLTITIQNNYTPSPLFVKKTFPYIGYNSLFNVQGKSIFVHNDLLATVIKIL